MTEQPEDFEERFAKLAKMREMVFDDLRQLGELHEDGILTDEEFSAKKAELLKRI